ncbi:MAG: AAC(3) family N-acetyltransferase [Gemmatimonadota bacterium]|nr:AAC(3) family N-acetyltransferase [Gemmatimonadota bacterium]
MTGKDKKKEYPQLTKELVAGGLREVGLKTGDNVFVHSSVKDLAPARQILTLPQMGMPYVVDGLKEVVGPRGLISFPTFSRCFVKRNTGPTGYVWDKRKVPSNVGSMTNYFRVQRSVQRSDHPTHSVAAWGEKAAEFVADGSYKDGVVFHRGGPWGRLCDWDFHILFYGTYIKTCTLVHAVEEWMGLPYMEEVDVLVKNEKEDVVVVKSKGSPSGDRDFYGNRGTKLEKLFEATARDFCSFGKICMADITLFKARPFVRWLWEALRADPWLLLKKDPDNEFCWKAGQTAEKYLADFDEPCPY